MAAPSVPSERIAVSGPVASREPSAGRLLGNVSTYAILIVFFLIVEPHGLARLWQITKEKLRIWPFPY